MRRVHIVVTGAVQGVGFRFSTKAEAERLGLTGWVRNVGSDRVEIEAQGGADAVERIVDWARRGPAYTEVAGVEAAEVSIGDVTTAEMGFQVLASR